MLVDVISTHWCWVLWFLQAIAIVLGFLVFVALIILLVFAVKTRSRIRRWGRDRILWEEVKVINDGLHNSVGEWVSVCVCVCVWGKIWVACLRNSKNLDTHKLWLIQYKRSIQQIMDISFILY